MDIKKIAEISNRVMHWEERLSRSRLKQSQIESDIIIAKREIYNAKNELKELLGNE